MNLRSLPIIVLTAFCFGTSLITSRFAVGQFEVVEFVALRFTLASLGYVFILLFNKRERWQLTPKMVQHSLFLGFFSTAVPVFSFVGALVYISSGVTAIMNSTGPAITVVLAHFFLKGESLSWRKGIGVLLSLGGAILLASRGESGIAEIGSANPLGYILVIIGLFAISISTIYTRRFTADVRPIAVTSGQLFAATIVTLPAVGLIFGFDLSDVEASGWFALAYGSLIGTVIAFLLYIYTIQKYGATDAALTTYVVPIIATLGGVLVLDETITGIMIVGMIIILSGIAVINSGGTEKK